jgi:transcription initiation factor TFIIF subunit alpha
VRPRKPVSSPLRRNQPTIKKEPGTSTPGGIRTPTFAASVPGNGISSNIATSLPSNGSSSTAPSAQSDETSRDYRLKAVSLDEVKDIRHHILKFHSRASVNPGEDFTAPIRFHRKDPRNLQFQLTTSEMEQRRIELEEVSAAERSGPETTKKPSADMSVVAPDGGARRTAQPFQKKIRQVQSGNEASRKLRYEEYYPWVMEDFDGKNTWVGSYEAAQSDAYALFLFDGNGFKMVPAEKFYKMTPRNKYATLSLEEAEQRMEKKSNVPRWIMKHISDEQQQDGVQLNQRRRFKTVDGSGPVRRGRASAAGDDEEELDYDEEFADDEEAPIMDGNEEDVKQVEEKIKKEQRNASYLGQPDDLAEEQGDENEPKIDREGRKLRKYLRSLEKNAFYESDDEENPYVSEKDSDDDEDMEDVGIKQEDQEKRSSSPAIKQEPTIPSVVQPIIRIIKREYNDLPPGMVILQLSPNALGKFPRDVWNPSAKRKRDDESSDFGDVKKSKIRERSKSKSWSPDPRSSPPNEDDLLTEEDVRSVIAAKPITTKELLGILQPKLKRHPQNPERLKALARKVARLHEGFLVLKEQ